MYNLCIDVVIITLFMNRSDFSVEVWSLDHTPHIERTIPGRANSSVEALTWCGERLFSSGLQGAVTEYNLQTLSVKVMLLL
jgi:U3 small nucleolar RNA-associated protein 4